MTTPKNEKKEIGSEEKKLKSILSYNYLAKRFKSDPVISKFVENLDKEWKCPNEKKGDDLEPIDKVVVIVGAGASLGAGLMLGNQAKEDLIKMVTSGDGEFPKIRKDIIAKELRKNVLKKGEIKMSYLEDDAILKAADFETVIETLSQFNSIKNLVNSRLVELFRARHNPILTYEILAHMFKYKIVDTIINYNFDELLDQSIEEELINDRYIKVIGGNDFNEFKKARDEEAQKRKTDEKYSLQYYLKPHGTWSDSESLRSTKRSYVENNGFNEILKEELKGRVAFLIIGFDMNSVELNNILSRNSEIGVLSPQFFFINPSKIDNIKGKLSLSDDCYENFDKKKELKMLYYPYQDLYKEKKKKKSDDCDDKKTAKVLNNLFKDLSEFLSKKYKGYRDGKEKNIIYPVWDINRHFAINRLFGNIEITARKPHINVDSDDVLFEDYFYFRVLIEILFSLGKGRSIINVIGLSKGRVGLLYELYFRYAPRAKSLHDICEVFDLIHATYSKEVLQIRKDNNPYLNDSLRGSRKNEISFYNEYSIELIKKIDTEIEKVLNQRESELSILICLKYKLSGKEKSLKETDKNIDNIKRVIKFIKRFQNRFNDEKVRDLLKKYSTSNFRSIPEMGHLFPTGNHLMYNEHCSIDIYSYEQMTFHFKQAIEKVDSYDEFMFSTNFIASEWLTALEKYDKIKNNLIIENSPVNRNIIEMISQEANIHYLDWWRHKRCAFLLLKSINKKVNNKNVRHLIPVFAIYYYHGSKSQTINPIIVDNMPNSEKENKLKKEEREELAREKGVILKRIYQDILAYKIKSENQEYSNSHLYNEYKEVRLIE